MDGALNFAEVINAFVANDVAASYVSPDLLLNLHCNISGPDAESNGKSHSIDNIYEAPVTGGSRTWAHYTENVRPKKVPKWERKKGKRAPKPRRANKQLPKRF